MVDATGKKESAPGLTIITVVKNNLEGLKRTYASLVQQSEQDFGWLVMDGQSTDGTLEWLKQIRRDGFKYHSEADKSLFDAMNKAIERTQTNHFIFLNSGDTFITNDVAARILGNLASGDIDVAYGQYEIGAVPGYPRRTRGRKIKSNLELFSGVTPCHQATVLSKQAIRKAGLYRLDVGIYGDREWILRYSKFSPADQWVYLPFPIAYYDPNGMSYHRFFKYSKKYVYIHWKNGSLPEFLISLIGWGKTAIYVLSSKLLKQLDSKSWPSRTKSEAKSKN